MRRPIRSRGGRGRGATVANADLIISSPSPPGPTCGRVHRRSIAVLDNVVAFTAPRRAIDTAAACQVRRGADGAVVNTVQWPPSRQDEVHVAELVPEVAGL
jgi:hypothetical protein